MTSAKMARIKLRAVVQDVARSTKSSPEEVMEQAARIFHMASSACQSFDQPPIMLDMRKVEGGMISGDSSMIAMTGASSLTSDSMDSNGSNSMMNGAACGSHQRRPASSSSSVTDGGGVGGSGVGACSIGIDSGYSVVSFDSATPQTLMMIADEAAYR